MIHPYHIDLADDEVAADLTSRLDRAVFRQVIEADIANPMAGAKAHAVLVDDRLTEVGKPAFATRMATTVFLHSLVQGVAAGVTPTEAKLAVYAPGDDLGLLEKQTEALLDQAFFLHFDGIRYRFSTEPSLAAVVNQERDLVGRASAKAEIDRRIRTIWKKGAFEPVFFPAEPSDVDDTLGRPKLVVLHYDAVSVSDQTHPLIVRLSERAGTIDGFRTYRNHLVFLAADAGAVDHAVDEARRYLAISRIIGDPQRYSQYSKDHRKRLKNLSAQTELTLRIAITRLYRHLFYPDAAAGAKRHYLSRIGLPAQQQGDVNQDQTQMALRILRELGKVRTADDKGIPPVYVRQKAWPANADRVTPLRIQKEFTSRAGLPILLDINILKETVKLGIKAGQWLYFDPVKQCAYSNESPVSPLVEITDDVELIVPEAAGGIPICGNSKQGPESTPPIPCPVCGNPQNACTCGGDIPTSPEVLKGEGSPSQAFQRVVDLAQDRKIDSVAVIEIRAAGVGRELSHDLQAMALAVPQLPKATKRVAVKGTFDLPGGDRMSIEYDGSWDRYRQISGTIQKAAKDADSATGHILLRLTFPSPVDPTGSEFGSIRDTFARINPGHVEVAATPAP